MSERLSLYAVMEFYAQKTQSPSIDIRELAAFLGQNAKGLVREQPEWAAWVVSPSAKIAEELPRLVGDKSHRVAINNDAGPTVLLIDLLENLIRDAYDKMEDDTEPFPKESHFRATLTPDLVRVVDVETGLAAYLDGPEEAPPPFIKLFFSKYGSAVILPDLFQRCLPEKALQKVRGFLRKTNNKEYFQSKLLPPFRGREPYVKEMFTKIMIRPRECLDDLEFAGAFSFSFWSYFCSLAKVVASDRDELRSTDIGFLQSLVVLEAFNYYYKVKVATRKARETALKNLAAAFDKPPYLLSLEAVLKLTDPKGIPLLGQYAEEDLDAFLRGKTTESEDGMLPELLILRDSNGIQHFIKKNLLLPCFTKLLVEARQPLKKAVVDRWFKLLKDFDREPAMDDDEAFEKLLSRTTRTVAPALFSILKDKRLLLVNEESSFSSHSSITLAPDDSIPRFSPPAELFAKGKLRPLMELFKIKRKEILVDVRTLLPFWYSIPVFSKIIEVFLRLFRRKKHLPLLPLEKSGEKEGEEKSEGNSPGSILKTSIAETARVVIPRGKTLEQALKDLKGHWGTLDGSNAQKVLIEDVNSLVRDRLRRTLRIQKSPRITPDSLKRLAIAIVNDSEPLQMMGGRDSLILYIELYIIKLVQRSDY